MSILPFTKQMTPSTTAALLLALAAFPASLKSADYYVSATTGTGKIASKEKPAKDLGNIITKLVAGDTIHIAGGTYTGRGDNGADVITVPVRIIGGYSDDFSKRDPWGEHRTIFTGINTSENYDGGPRLLIDLMRYKEKEMPPIEVDGIIIDDSGRNRYASENMLEIIRMANPKTGENPSPSQGALIIRVSKTGNFDPGAHWDIAVRNCIVINSGPTQGALSVAGYRGTKVTIENNIVANNTGSAVYASTKYVGDEEPPSFSIKGNTVLFTWKYEPGAQSYSGNSFKADGNTVVRLENNVLAFADRAGIHNAAKAPITLVNNLILGNVETDYLEFDTGIDLKDILDEAEVINENSEGNVAEDIDVPIDREWLDLYGTRVLVDRTAAEADIKAQNSRANELRRILGLPLQGDAVDDGPSTPVWLHALPLDEAISAGSAPYLGKYGSTKP